MRDFVAMQSKVGVTVQKGILLCVKDDPGQQSDCINVSCQGGKCH